MVAIVGAAFAGDVVFEDVRLDGGREGSLPARIYRPADATGPLPLAGFLHGWLGSTWMYDEVCTALADQGFVVVSLDTQSGVFLETDLFADQAVAMMDAVEARAATTGDPLFGLVAGGDRVAMGHSMGGATLMRWVELDPRIRAAVAFMPYQGYPGYYRDLADYDGSLLILSGTHDTTAPAPMQDEWLDATASASRAVRLRVTDMGHQSVTDLNFEEDPMPDDEQRVIVVDLAMAFVAAEFQGDESRWADVVGPGLAGLEVDRRSRSVDPVLWAELDGDQIVYGVVGQEGASAALFFEGDDAPAATFDLGGGVVGPARIDAPDGDVHVVVRVGDAWTRTVTLREDGEIVEPGDDEPTPDPVVEPGDEPADEASAEPDAARDSCGCATGGSTSTVAPLLLGGLIWRRRATRRSASSTSRSAC